MQPFDDFLPAERNPQNEEMLTFLRQSHGISDIIAAEPEPHQKELALAAVRQRLLEMRQAQLIEEPTQMPVRLALPPSDLIQAPVPRIGSEAKAARRPQWKRGMALLAATFCAVILVGSMLTVIGLVKRGDQSQRPNTQISTQTTSQSLYVVTPGWLQKVAATTGVLIWQAQLPYQQQNDGPPMDFPLVGNGAVYVTAANTLLAFNATNGEQLWRVTLHDGFADAGGEFAQPVLAHGRLYFALQYTASGTNRVEMILEAFDASSGHVLWQYHPLGMIEGLVVENTTVYTSIHDKGNTLRQNNLVALDAADGSQQWSVKVNTTQAPVVGVLNADSDLVVKNGVIYQLASSSACGTKDGSCLFAYRADSGTFLWHSPNLVPAFFQQNKFIFWFEGSLIASGNALYIDSTGGLCAIDARNGQLLWRQSEGSMLTSKPANHPLDEPFAGKGNPGTAFVVAGGTIFHIEMTGQGNYLTALNTSNGQVIARKHIENFLSSLSAQVTLSTKQYTGSLLLEGLMTASMSYVFHSIGHLDALDNRTGASLWSIRLAGGGAAVLTLAP